MRRTHSVGSMAIGLLTAMLVVTALPSAVSAAQVPTTTYFLYPPAAPFGWREPIHLQAKIQPTPDPDPGVVTLSVDGVDVATDTNNPNGVVGFDFPDGLAPGTYSLVATFAGTIDAAPSASDPFELTVVDDRTPVTVTLESDGSPSLRGEPVGLHVTVSPDPGADGTVQIVRADTTGIINLPVPIGAGGETDISWTPTATFDYPIKACFSGNDSFGEDCSAPITQSVFAYATTTTLEILPSELYLDESLTLRVTVDPPPEVAVNARVGLGAFDGWYVGIDPVTGIGEATIVPFIWRTHLALGHHELTAFYPGSPNTDPSQSSAEDLDIVQDATTTVVVITPSAVKGGQHATISVSVDPAPTDLPLVGVSVDHPTLAPWVAAVDLDGSGHGSVDFDGTGWPDGVFDVTATFGGTDRLAGSEDLTTIKVDRTAPTGSVSIAAGAATTRTRTVTLNVTATDALTPVTHVLLSNDGTTWTSRAYAPTQPWTLAAGDGTKTVRVKWRDALGNWSAHKLDTIVLDTVAPTATAPTRAFVAGTAIDAGRIAVRLAWTGSDATSGIARFELYQQTDHGAWTLVSATLTSPAMDRGLATQHDYAFRLRAVDKAGNTGSWVTGSTFRVSRYNETNAAISYSGTWTTVSSSVYWGGVAKKSSAAGATAAITFSGRSIAWVARTGPDRGKAAIYVDGVKVVTVDLYSASFGNQRIAWVGSWTTGSSRTVTIKVLGTTDRPRIDLDAIVTAN